MQTPKKKIAIIGAGPAGLTAAYLLGKEGGYDVTVFEQHPSLVGGISRTESYKGYLFDIGGHRFFSKSQEVESFWTEILGDDLLERPRSSRIYYNRKFFSYPLAAGEALRKLGLLESVRCVVSYLQARLKPASTPRSFEDWVSQAFGERLYRIFFKTYTEKVWGIPCHEISADWAAQRIKGLSLSAAIRNAILPQSKSKGKDKLIKTLIDSFRYPKYGPGQMWETCRSKAVEMGVCVRMNTTVTRLAYHANRRTWDLTCQPDEPAEHFDYVISSAPLRQLVAGVHGAFSPAARAAAAALRYRDFLTVVLILKDRQLFNDNWIYIHDPSVKVGRIQNFKSWSPYMVPEEGMVCYGLEYFCFEGDGLWSASDEKLTQLAVAELEKIGLAQPGDVKDSYVVRQPKAYPVYDQFYQDHLNIIREEADKLPGLMLVGRNGMHKYNNQDHSMMTAMLAVKNIVAGRPVYDLWRVNQDAEYHEEGARGNDTGGRLVPSAVSHNG
ncbi:MAG: NAD(P)/FAD-dependent oxidoreductase [Chitinophagaceae bacterium]|nr:NAD(P)/FAD-dependent oxidoreductase [Chitinophagaceae bacterium]